VTLRKNDLDVGVEKFSKPVAFELIANTDSGSIPFA
jgi:hypothetical protein